MLEVPNAYGNAGQQDAATTVAPTEANPGMSRRRQASEPVIAIMHDTIKQHSGWRRAT